MQNAVQMCDNDQVLSLNMQRVRGEPKTSPSRYQLHLFDKQPLAERALRLAVRRLKRQAGCRVENEVCVSVR